MWDKAKNEVRLTISHESFEVEGKFHSMKKLAGEPIQVVTRYNDEVALITYDPSN